MPTLLSSFLASLLSTFFIIRYCNLHPSPFMDDEWGRVQRAHYTPVPRVGGVAVLFGLLVGAFLNALLVSPKALFIWQLIFFVTPAFVIGLIEDIQKRLSVKLRLLIIACSGLLFTYFGSGTISHLDIWGDEILLSHSWMALMLAVFAVTGLTNAYNLIDGLNGLASMVGIISLLAIAYVGFLVGDVQIQGASFLMVGSIAGFFLWNYPRGLIFLGDGGSYLIGCWTAFLSILLVERNISVSPWFAIMVNAYPVFETIFSMYRRKIHRGTSPGTPDGVHFHMLLYRRIVRLAGVSKSLPGYQVISNSKTSPYLWLLSSIAVIPAILFWQNSLALQISFILFCGAYIFLYRSLVQFRSPKWLRRN